ncbi:hypothetical protein IEQ34_011056 [Dendrobium chrysotoxum]|uniref:Uncharacterized protein n=1 Tax=Dendrobium chrysotoxum TaxID=161865 RepID=A0AAV7GXN9_DENCH|nr:hypothetical protein IEQ34_011056 [Dendrobium chrysotoxum]
MVRAIKVLDDNSSGEQDAIHHAAYPLTSPSSASAFSSEKPILRTPAQALSQSIYLQCLNTHLLLLRIPHPLLDSTKSEMMNLQHELEETKRKVTLLKQRGSEIEITIASLNIELHKSKVKLTRMEVASGVFT